MAVKSYNDHKNMAGDKMLSIKEYQLISHLRQNARATLTNLSRKTGVPISTIYDKLKHHEHGLIRKHTSLLDFSKLGYDTRVNMLIKVSKDKKDECKEFLLKNQSINSVFKINNGFDFLIEAIFSSIRDFEDFKENIECRFDLEDIKAYYVIDEVKREAFMSDPLLMPA